MKIGIVGNPGGWSSEKLADAAEKLTGYRLLINMEDTWWDSEKNTAFYRTLDLSGLDALIIKKIGVNYSPHLLDRLYTLDFLHKHGSKIFSKPSAILLALDRLSCTLKLKTGGIPMPPVIVTENIEKGCEAVVSFGQAVFKPLFSSKARGMTVISADEPDVRQKVSDFKDAGNPLMYIQKFIHIPGEDLGVIFLGGKYFATYARVSDGKAWNTTINSGGKYAAYEPDEKIIELAMKAQSLFGLDYTSVDIVETEDGPMVFEVSAFGGFRGLYDSYGINAAEKYFAYVMERIR